MVEKLLSAAVPEPGEISGRGLAYYLVLSELLSTLVKQQLLQEDQVHHILWNSSMRLYDIRCDLAEMRSPLDGKKLQDDGQDLLNLIEHDVESELRRFSKRRGRA